MTKCRIVLFISLLFFSFKTIAQDNWTFVKSSVIRESISGTITKGYIFKVGPSEFYIVNEFCRQRVRVRNPSVSIFQRGIDYKLIIEDFDEPVICRKIKNALESQIDGEFNGWEGETIFKLMNGDIWQQSSPSILLQMAFYPQVLIYEFNNHIYIKVEGVDEVVEVRGLKQNNLKSPINVVNVNESKSTSSSDIIESNIDGEFNGWEGETIFKLLNGQIWQQSSYSYYYHYAYSPKVYIYKTSGGYEMQVKDLDKRIKVKRLK